METGSTPFGGDALAVHIPITDDGGPAFDATIPQLPKFRAAVTARPADGQFPGGFETPEAASFLGRRIIDEIRAARTKYRPRGEVHVFAAIPTGLAVLIGQMSNTLGAMNVYEHVEDGAVGS